MTSAGSAPYPVYDEISSPETTFYKWSNDNKVYTELSATVEVDDGYLVFFLGESPSLDNSLTGEEVNAPRNVGYTKVTKDLTSKLSAGGVEEGGFYTYGGSWSTLNNEGISWISDFRSKTSTLSRLKTFKISSTRILLMFELWDPSNYVGTYFRIVDENGSPLTEITELCHQLRLLRSDDVFVNSGNGFFINGEDGKVVTYDITINI